jgi:hypothetical protein
MGHWQAGLPSQLPNRNCTLCAAGSFILDRMASSEQQQSSSAVIEAN